MSLFYRFTYRLQKRILVKNDELKRKMNRFYKTTLVLFPIFLILCFLSLLFLNPVVASLILILLFADMIANFISDALRDPLYSLTHMNSKDMTSGLIMLVVKVCSMVFLFLFMVSLVGISSVESTNAFFEFAPLIIPYLLTLMVYVSIMCLGECKVVSTVNGIFSALISLFLLIKSYILNLLPPNYFKITQLEQVCNQLGYSYTQILDIGIMTLLLPIVLMTTLGLIFSLGKKLWLETNGLADIEYAERSQSGSAESRLGEVSSAYANL